MSGKGDTFENDVQKLVFNATPIANLADNAAASPLTDLQTGLYTADPGEGGNQTTNETSYTNYARVAKARSSSGWTVTANVAENNGPITFPTCGATGATLTHVGIGSAASGTGKLMYFGALTASLVVSSGVTPEFASGQLDVVED